MDADEVRNYAGDKYISEGDIERHLTEVDDERESLVEDAENAEDEVERWELFLEVARWDDENKEARDELADFAGQISVHTSLIHDDDIGAYLRNMCDDIGDLNKIPSYIEIDWDSTIANLKQDYSEYDYAGHTYWGRE